MFSEASPHDTRWDAVQTRSQLVARLMATRKSWSAPANRNGYFFLLDRVTGKDIVSEPREYSGGQRAWTQEWEPDLRPPAKEPSVAGTLECLPRQEVRPTGLPRAGPQTETQSYVNTFNSYSVFYLTDTDPQPEGYAAIQRKVGGVESSLRALDYKTGKTVWRHDYPGDGGVSGVLSTAGRLVFSRGRFAQPHCFRC